MHRLLLLIGIPLFAATIFLSSQRDAEGCAAVPRLDRPGDTIRIAEESAIIVWDPVKKIQHFIRSAAFDTPSPDFGFLVPTPGPDIPKLKELEESLFSTAASWMQPRVVTQSQLKFEPFLCGLMLMKSAAPGSRAGDVKSAPDNLKVLAEQKVGGFETAIIEADNTKAMADWLKEKGYSNDPELQSWLFPYVAAKWRITAFKIMQDPKTGALAKTKPVRMSFATDKPFFPYREPEGKEKKEAKETKDGKSKASDARLLRVFFISDTRMDGQLGAAAWHANVKWTDALTEEQRTRFAKESQIPDGEIPANAWMTTFEDHASPRPGKDEVYFVPAQDRTPIRPPDIVHIVYTHVPIDLIAIGIIGFAIFLGIGFTIIRTYMKKPAST